MLLLANAHICIKNDAHQLQALELIHMDMDVQLGGGGRHCLVLISAPPLLPPLLHSAHHKDSMQCI